MKKSLVVVAMLSAIFSSSLTVLAVYAGDSFPDVNSNAYYSDSVYRMQDLGVIEGYSNGNFGPNDKVTRAQVAAMIDRYNQHTLSPNKEAGTPKLVDILCYGLKPFIADPIGSQAYEEICDIAQ